MITPSYMSELRLREVQFVRKAAWQVLRSPTPVRAGLDLKCPDSWPELFLLSLPAPGGPGQNHCSHFPDGQAEALLKDSGAPSL